MRNVIRIKKVIKSNQLKRRVCNGCVERLKGVLTDEQIKRFEKAFYLASEDYLFSESKG